MGLPAAFVLAAGLGTRLAPLTDRLPKPLVPIYHKPLVTFALDSLMAAGVGTIALNTHHLPEAFPAYFGTDPHYRARPLSLFHEPVLLDTGGGIRNARPALANGTFFLYNGDILADLPLTDLLHAHRSSGAMATLMLRRASGGGMANVLFDEPSGRILDLRSALGVREGELTVYSGIAAFEPAIFDWIPPEGPSSIIDALLDAMREGERVGGMMSEGGLWFDIGTSAAYFGAHRVLSDPDQRPAYVIEPGWPSPVHPLSNVDPKADLEGMVVVGEGAAVGKGAVLRNSILWPGCVIGSAARLEECLVIGNNPVMGEHKESILSS
jgi:NDP-sugar pyrophosphorylase family protein